MTGLDKEVWKKNFDRVQFVTEALALKNEEEVRVLNPASFGEPINNPTWADYITEDIHILTDNATHILMFGEWWTSLGCWVELFSAIRMDKEVLFYEDGVRAFLTKRIIKYFKKRCVDAGQKREEKAKTVK